MGEKFKPWVIGKSENPRCFKNVNKAKLPVKYRANKKAWMTGAIFQEYLEWLNGLMVKQKRKVLLLIDNASSHGKIVLSNVRVKFYPPNCTSRLQPLDQGIIKTII
jgi:hypothetical protein